MANKRQVFAEDVRFFRSCGESFAQMAISKYGGIQLESMARALYREGEDAELAAEVDRVARAIKPLIKCACGNPVGVTTKSGKCRSCISYDRWRDPEYRAKATEAASRVSEGRQRTSTGQWAS